MPRYQKKFNSFHFRLDIKYRHLYIIIDMRHTTNKKEAKKMILQKIADQKIQEGIDNFLWYVGEVGIEKAKEIMIKETGFAAVINFINNYK